MAECSCLSDDVMIKILLLLPAKSLAKFKSVCKKWYNFIQNPNFITEYSNVSNKHKCLLVFPVEQTAEYFGLVLDESFSIKQKFDNPIISNGHPINDIRLLQLLGPVNGLYCIHWTHPNNIVEDSIALWNPSTSEFRQIIFPSFLFCEIGPHIANIGFGSTDDDIKLVCIAYDVAGLYSLARDCWSQIEYSPIMLLFTYNDLAPSASLDGAFYWVMDEWSSSKVYVFDTRNEVFRQLSLPDIFVSHIGKIYVRNNSIVLVDGVNIWEMKEEGCWNKIFSFALSFLDQIPIKFWKDDEIIFSADSINELVLYNIHSNDSRLIGTDARYFPILDYEESLTSVRGGNGLIQVL